MFQSRYIALLKVRLIVNNYSQTRQQLTCGCGYHLQRRLLRIRNGFSGRSFQSHISEELNVLEKLQVGELFSTCRILVQISMNATFTTGGAES